MRRHPPRRRRAITFANGKNCVGSCPIHGREGRPERVERPVVLLVFQRLHRRLRAVRRHEQPRRPRQPDLHLPRHEPGGGDPEEPDDRAVGAGAGRHGAQRDHRRRRRDQAQLRGAATRVPAAVRPARADGEHAGGVRRQGRHLLLLAVARAGRGARHRLVRRRWRPPPGAGHRRRRRLLREHERRAPGRPRLGAAADGAAGACAPARSPRWGGR